jgi:uncharacterized protein
MPFPELIEKNKQEIMRIATRHGARNVRVFGSFARGEAGPQSDLDFLVEMAPQHTPFFPGGFMADMEELLHRKIDVVTEKGLHPIIREKVLKEATPL